ASIFLTALFVVSLLLITDLSFLGMWGNFEMARDNFRIHFDEWKAKRAAIRAQRTMAAKENMAKRRDKRLGEPAVNSPTITLPDAPKTRANVKATKALTDEEIAQNGVPVGDDEQIPPTIAVPDSVAAAPKETFAPGDI